MRLGIDLDGVVADFTTGWKTFYNRDFGLGLPVEESDRWNDIVELTHFEDPAQFWTWAEDLDGRSVFWHLETYPGAVEALQELSEAGHQIVIITQKPSYAFGDTIEWLDQMEIPTDEIHIFELGKANGKWEVECDVYLDDSPLVVPELVRHRPDRLVCRYVRRWNHPVPGAIDIHDFDQFRDLVGSGSEGVAKG